MDRDRPDVLDDDDDEADDTFDDAFDDTFGRDDEHARESIVEAVLTPQALALAALVLAGLSLAGLGLLNGSPYLPSAFSEGPPERSTLALTALLGAALALLPLGLGVWALRRLPDGAPSRATAGAAVLVSGVSLLLRLVIAARTAADGSVPFVQF